MYTVYTVHVKLGAIDECFGEWNECPCIIFCVIHVGMCVLVSGALTISMSHADSIMTPLLTAQQAQHEIDVAHLEEDEKHKIPLAPIQFDPEWLKTMYVRDRMRWDVM